MATKDTDHSIPKENKDIDIEDSESAESEADRYSQHSELDLDIHNSFSTKPKLDSGRRCSIYNIERNNTPRNSIPYQIQEDFESRTNCLDDTASEITRSSPKYTDIESISFKENADHKQTAHEKNNAELNRKKLTSYDLQNSVYNEFQNNNYYITKLKILPQDNKIITLPDYNKFLLQSQKLRDKRDIIMWHNDIDRDGVHMLRERIQRLWNREVQGNDIAIDLEMEAAVGMTEMEFDTRLFDVYRIILVYVTQSFDEDKPRRFRMESILKESRRSGGNISRRVIPLWVDVEPGHSHHIQLNILKGLSADSDTKINNLLRLLAFDSE